MRLNFDLVTGFSLVPLQLFSLLGIVVVAGLGRRCIVVVHRYRHLSSACGDGARACSGTATSCSSSSSAWCSSAWGSSANTSGRIYQQVREPAALPRRRRCWRSDADAHRSAAVVFAYHDVGVRCLRVLLEHGVEVPLVVTHRDDPAETLWFASVADARARNGHRDRWTIPTIRRAESVETLRDLRPTSSSRSTTAACSPPECSRRPARGAFNMHGSLLPKYRGRAPVNWAVLTARPRPAPRCTRWSAKPDAGRIVDQQRGADPARRNRASRCSARSPWRRRWSCAVRCRRSRRQGARLHEQDLARGSYFGGAHARGRAHRLVEAARARSTTWCAPWRRPTRAPSPRSAAASATDARHRTPDSVHPGTAAIAHRRPHRSPLRRRRRAARPRSDSTASVLDAPIAATFDRSRHARHRMKNPHPRRQRLHRPSPLQAHPRDHRLGGVRHGHAGRPHRRPASTTRASTSSKATSPSTRSGSSTTSASATWCCRWWRSRRRRPT